MKGISAVLATVLIVVITVAIIGLAYGWATGLFRITTEASEEQVGGVTENLQKSVDIVALSCNNIDESGSGGADTNYLRVTIKNTGTLEIDPSELTLFVDETNIDSTDWEKEGFTVRETYKVGESRQLVYSLTVTGGDMEPEREIIIKVDAPAGPVEETVTCPSIRSFAIIP